MSRRAVDLAQQAAKDRETRQGPRWFCRVPGCSLAGRAQPARSHEEALTAADRHVTTRHPEDPPEDLDEQRARWVAAGRPPLGTFPA